MATSIRCSRCGQTTELEEGDAPACSNCSAPLDVAIDLDTGRIAPRPTVLIVDDEASARDVARFVLQDAGYAVIGEASNGPDAALLAGRHQPAFVVLDYRMPAMTGEHTARLLRKVSPHSRIVVFSAVIDQRPAWADAAVRKDEVDRLVDSLASLMAGDRTGDKGADRRPDAG